MERTVLLVLGNGRGGGLRRVAQAAAFNEAGPGEPALPVGVSVSRLARCCHLSFPSPLNTLSNYSTSSTITLDLDSPPRPPLLI